MAKKKKRRSGKSMTTTAFKFIRLGALAAPAIGHAVHTGWTNEMKLAHVLRSYTGYQMHPIPNPGWKPEFLLEGWGPYLGSVLATYGIPKIASIIRRM